MPESTSCQYLGYMLAGYGAIWIIVFAYVLRLRGRERELRRELEELRAQVVGTGEDQAH